MPELIPSDNYGMLLPYSSAAMLDDGSLRTSKIGFVTIDGIVVTDLIYDDVRRAEAMSYTRYGPMLDPFPAYWLLTDIPGTETSLGYSDSLIAACALDGSWITGFEYVDITFTDDVILLARSFEKFDIDVIDYNGNHLYNMLELNWIDEILIGMKFDESAYSSPGSFTYSIDQGYGVANLKDGTIAFVEVLTGEVYYTDYVEARAFDDGFAAVAVRDIEKENIGYSQMLWGLINTDFEIVIPPKYSWPPVFSNGKAIVQLPDDSQQVINTKGEILFNVPQGYRIEYSYYGSNFFMYDLYGNDPGSAFFTDNFEKIILPEELQSLQFNYLQHLSNGWYTSTTEAGALLINENEVHFFPDLLYIGFSDGEIISYSIRDSDYYGSKHYYGVMTFDGREIIQLETDILINPVIQNDTVVAFIVSTGLFAFSTGQDYIPNTYRLYDTTGNIITQGNGILTYYEYLELYSLQGENHYSWLDKDANPIITIPLLSSTFD